MNIFIAVCLAILVVEMSVLVVVLTVVLLQIRKTSQAVEVLAYRVDQQVAGFGELIRSGWMQALQTTLRIIDRVFCKG